MFGVPIFKWEDHNVQDKHWSSWESCHWFIISKVFHVKRPPEIILSDVDSLFWGFLRIFMHVDIKKTWSLLKVKTTTTCCRSRSNYIRFQHCFPVTIMPGNSLLNIKLGIYPKAVIKVQWGFTVRYQWKRKGSQHKFPALEPWGQSSLSQGDLIQLKERVCHVDSSHVREKEESRYIAARW